MSRARRRGGGSDDYRNSKRHARRHSQASLQNSSGVRTRCRYRNRTNHASSQWGLRNDGQNGKNQDDRGARSRCKFGDRGTYKGQEEWLKRPVKGIIREVDRLINSLGHCYTCRGARKIQECTCHENLRTEWGLVMQKLSNEWLADGTEEPGVRRDYADSGKLGHSTARWRYELPGNRKISLATRSGPQVVTDVTMVDLEDPAALSIQSAIAPQSPAARSPLPQPRQNAGVPLPYSSYPSTIGVISTESPIPEQARSSQFVVDLATLPSMPLRGHPHYWTGNAKGHKRSQDHCHCPGRPLWDSDWDPSGELTQLGHGRLNNHPSLPSIGTERKTMAEKVDGGVLADTSGHPVPSCFISNKVLTFIDVDGDVIMAEA